MKKIFFEKKSLLNNSDQMEIEKIFWLTSGKKKKEFSSDLEQKIFLDAYLNLYLDQGENYVAKLPDKIVGYITFHKSTKDLFKNAIILNNYRNFNQEIIHYPVSLHINVSPEVQGMGVGQKLIEFSLKDLGLSNKVHLITHIDSRNIRFYERVGFKEIKVDSRGLVFLAGLI